MKFLFLISTLVTNYAIAQSRNLPVFKVEYACEAFLKPSKESKIVFENHSNTAVDSTAFVNSLFPKMSYRFLSQNVSIGDSAVILQHGFHSTSRMMNFAFDSVVLLATGDSIFRETIGGLKSLNEPQKDANRYYGGRLTYTDEKITINNYQCVVAHLESDADYEVYVCTDLPPAINPGVYFANAKGAVLGIKSRALNCRLKSLSNTIAKGFFEQY